MEQKNEIWKDISDYIGYYQISNLGRIRSLDRMVSQKKCSSEYSRLMKGKILKTKITNSGYELVHLSKDGVVKAYTVHKLVYMAFNGDYDFSLQINHKDGNKTNNRLENLELVNQSDNVKHSYRVLNHKKYNALQVRCVESNEVFNSIVEASKRKNINRGSISHAINGRAKKAGGYSWEAVRSV